MITKNISYVGSEVEQITIDYMFHLGISLFESEFKPILDSFNGITFDKEESLDDNYIAYKYNIDGYDNRLGLMFRIQKPSSSSNAAQISTIIYDKNTQTGISNSYLWWQAWYYNATRKSHSPDGKKTYYWVECTGHWGYILENGFIQSIYVCEALTNNIIKSISFNTDRQGQKLIVNRKDAYYDSDETNIMYTLKAIDVTLESDSECVQSDVVTVSGSKFRGVLNDVCAIYNSQISVDSDLNQLVSVDGVKYRQITGNYFILDND